MDVERTQRKAFIRWLTKDEAAKLPVENWLDESYDIQMEDREDGKLYAGRHSMPIVSTLDDRGQDVPFYDEDFNEVERFVIQPYFAYSHFCGCHRATAMGDVVETRLDCPANRFLVRSITHPALPGVNLYYEEPVGDYVGENE